MPVVHCRHESKYCTVVVEGSREPVGAWEVQHRPCHYHQETKLYPKRENGTAPPQLFVHHRRHHFETEQTEPTDKGTGSKCILFIMWEDWLKLTVLTRR